MQAFQNISFSTQTPVEAKGHKTRSENLATEFTPIQCDAIINAINFLQDIHKRHPQLTCQGDVWGVFCGCCLWLILGLTSCNTVL